MMTSPSESELQVQVVAWLRLHMPGLLFWHTPNEGLRSYREGRKMRAMGLYAGMADLTFILKGNRVGFIELKTQKGKQTEAQSDFQERVQSMGVPYVICRSLEEVIITLGHWQEKGLL